MIHLNSLKLPVLYLENPKNNHTLFFPFYGMLILVAVLYFVEPKPNSTPAFSITSEVLEDSVFKVKLAFVGDIMSHLPVINGFQISKDSFDFRPGFERIQKALQSADWTFGNFETVCGGSKLGYHGYPAFNAPDDYLDGLKWAGFDFLATTNNHSLDRGWDGLKRTYQMLDSLHIEHTGTFLSPSDRDSIRMVDLNGLKLAVVGYSYGTNGMPIPAGKPWCINLMDSTLIEKDIKAAKTQGADLVLAYFHWGEEYQRVPNSVQKRFADWSIHCGADLVIACHPHVIQPVEFYKTENATLDSGLIAWSLGNFFSNQVQRYCDAGVILFVELSRHKANKNTWISDVSYLPTWVYRSYNPLEKKHYIFPAEVGTTDSFPSFFTPECKQKITESYSDTKLKMAERNQGRLRLLKMSDF